MEDRLSANPNSATAAVSLGLVGKPEKSDVPGVPRLPWWVLLFVGFSGMLLIAGVSHAALTGHSLHVIKLDSSALAASVITGGVGRLFAVLVQTGAATTFSGRKAKERANRNRIVVVALLAQLPLAVRDTALGALTLVNILICPGNSGDSYS